nr:hypothetical protein [uncultured Undibacterium sp.]
MNMKKISLGVTLATFAGFAFSQEFVVSQSQMNSQPVCQENCPADGANGGQGALQIDRSGMDKASVHLQVLQQSSQKFSEPAANAKKNNDDKKPSSKAQSNS